MSTWSEALLCEWLSWTADPSAPVLRLSLPVANCCDMAGAVSLATRLRPGVERVEVSAGGLLDIVYHRGIDGTWGAVNHRRAS